MIEEGLSINELVARHGGGEVLAERLSRECGVALGSLPLLGVACVRIRNRSDDKCVCFVLLLSVLLLLLLLLF